MRGNAPQDEASENPEERWNMKSGTLKAETENQRRNQAAGSADEEFPNARLTWRPVVAGIMEILASAPYFVSSVMFYLFPTRVQMGSITYSTGETTPVIVQVWAPTGLIMWLPFALPLAAAGVCSLFRKGWDLALLGPIVTLALTALSLAWGHLGLTAFGSLFAFGWVPSMGVRWAIVAGFLAMMVAAIVLVALSRKEFPRRRKPTAYHGSGPG